MGELVVGGRGGEMGLCAGVSLMKNGDRGMFVQDKSVEDAKGVLVPPTRVAAECSHNTGYGTPADHLASFHPSSRCPSISFSADHHNPRDGAPWSLVFHVPLSSGIALNSAASVPLCRLIAAKPQKVLRTDDAV